MQRPSAVQSAVKMGALASRHVSRVCLLSIAMLTARGIIGQNIRNCVSNVLPIRNEALFKEPPPKEDCPICFLPMPIKLIACASLPPATITSVPIHEFAIANEELAGTLMEHYYSCCGKSICLGCAYTFHKSGNSGNCPFCNADQDKTDGEQVEELMKRVEANDAGAIYVLGNYYYHGKLGLLQDSEKALELFTKAADLGYSQAHFQLGVYKYKGGDMKKAKFHYEASAMAGHEIARYTLGCMDFTKDKWEQALKHWVFAASAGSYQAMDAVIIFFTNGYVRRESVDSTLAAYNISCAEMRSEARDAYIQLSI